MSDPLSTTSDRLPVSSPPPVKLWTPRAIGYITFFLGFPGGLGLAALNWMRMGLKKKVLTHLLAGAAAAPVFAVLLLLPANTGRLLAFAVNIGVLFYLKKQMEKDIEAFRAGEREVQSAHWSGGCLIGLVMSGLFLSLTVVVAFLLTLIGVPIPE